MFKYIAYAAAVSLAAAVVARAVPAAGYPVVALAIRSIAFGTVVALGYGIIYKRLLWIIRQHELKQA